MEEKYRFGWCRGKYEGDFVKPIKGGRNNWWGAGRLIGEETE